MLTKGCVNIGYANLFTHLIQMQRQHDHHASIEITNHRREYRRLIQPPMHHDFWQVLMIQIQSIGKMMRRSGIIRMGIHVGNQRFAAAAISANR